MVYKFFTYNLVIVVSLVLLGAGCVAKNGDSLSDRIFLPEEMPSDVSISWYKYISPKRTLGKPGPYKRYSAEISLDGGVYNVDIGGKKEEIKFVVTRDKLVQLYGELKKLRVDEITTNTGGYDGDNVSMGIAWGKDSHVSVGRNQIEYIDYEWQEAFGSATYLIESFVIEQI